MSKLNEYLAKAKISSKQVLAASKRVEGLKNEDRAIRLARKQVAGGKPTDAQKELATQKVRSGRKVSNATLEKALAGGTISKQAKKRVARAVSAVLTQKKKGEAAVADLF
ncbi:MAG: hypothetical protein JRH11_17745 [Deltaproteobacteria bacterium]|nr:hypothetical protein [Deltaproteobacteria bacterium]